MDGHMGNPSCSRAVTLPTNKSLWYLPRRKKFLYTFCRTSCCRASRDEDGSLSVLNDTRNPQETRHICGLSEAARYARKDAMLMTAAAQNMDERARRDLVLLACEFSRLDMRARKHVGLIGSKLDARAKADSVKLDQKAERIVHIASKLKKIARAHWSDGALEADLRLANLRACRRAMEDSYAAVQAVKGIHAAAANVLRLNVDASETQHLEVETQHKHSNELLDGVSKFEDSYFSLASDLRKTDITEQGDDLEELQYIVATLLDLDEVGGASGALLVTETSSSPDIATRRALVDALAAAPSLWSLGNAGISALQRLAEDSNQDVAAAALKALDELECEWQQLNDSMLSEEFDGVNKFRNDTDSDED